MTWFAHVMGIPVEETALALAPAGAAIATGAVVLLRRKLASIGQRLRRNDAPAASRETGARRSRRSHGDESDQGES